MTTIISGLLLQKAGSPAPEPGDERWFSWEQKKGKSGKEYIKIKNEGREYGGKLCTIVDAEKTDFVDQHGNVSYNVGFEPKEADEIPMTHDSKGAALPAVDEAKRHVIQASNFYNICVDAVDTIVKPNVDNMTAEMYQAAVSSVFIEGSRSGLISKMPTSPIKGHKSNPTPF